MRYVYRFAVAGASIALTGMVYMIQQLFQMWTHGSAVPGYEDYLTAIWLTTLPVALCLWLGWILFIGRTPWKQHVQSTDLKTSLIIRYVTRGINVEAIECSVETAMALLASNGIQDRVKLQVVSDRTLSLPKGVDLILVPLGYRTQKGSLFKARALRYLQEVRPLGSHEWVLYLDEESRLTESSLQGISLFISRHHGKQRPPIGQGPIAYTGGSWFWRGADALRLADDLGRFQLQYALGIPLFGVHGSYLLLRGDVDRALSFDVGRSNSLTEDTAWALMAWQKGYRFGWVNGFLLEQPPCNVRDFLRQRQRWLSGMKLVVRDSGIRLRYKFVVMVYTYLWQFSFVSVVLSLVSVLLGLHAPTPIRLMTDFSLSVYVLAYTIGNIVTGYITGRWGAVLSSLLYPVFGVLEAVGALLALRKGVGFYVVSKPRSEPGTTLKSEVS